MKLAIGLVLLLGLGVAPAMAEIEPPRLEPKLEVGGAMTVWFPSGDVDETVDASLGVRPHLAYWPKPMIAIAGSFDFVFVNEQEGVDDVTYYAVSVGPRVTIPRPMKVKPYGELMLGWHHLDGEGVDESGIGFRLGGGVSMALGSALAVNAGVGYSSVSFDGPFGINIDVDALVLDVGAVGRF
jgi:hypothetical protein